MVAKLSVCKGHIDGEHSIQADLAALSKIDLLPLFLYLIFDGIIIGELSSHILHVHVLFIILDLGIIHIS